MPRTLGLVVVALPVCLLALLGADSSSTDAEMVERGAFVYEAYCRSCHGAKARGDGPMVEFLTVKPADLTRLARANDGEFPAEKTYRVIDGRDRIRGHGIDRMPIWGLSFQEPGSDVNQEYEVRRKIDQLVHYLSTIQEK
jgi:mono/diheme cytochrome c family protein